MLFVRPRGWHLDERHFEVDGSPMSGSLFDFGLYFLPQPRSQRALLLPAEARVAPRGAALERRLLLDAGPARRPARDDQGDRADRDDPRRVRDGRDPLRAARPLGRPQRRPLGLHLQRDQEARPPARVRAPRPRGRDDGRAVHALLLRAAREDVPPPRRARDGRHGGVHPVPPRPGGERASPSRRCARTRSARRRRASTGRGSRIPTSCRSRWSLRPRCSATGRTRSTGSATTFASAPQTCSTSRPPRATSPRTACATTSRSGSSTSRRGSRARARSRSTT